MNLIAKEDSNEVDEILKDIETKLKFESFIDKNLLNAEKFLKKDDWRIILNLSHYFHQNIERVWPYFQTFDKFKAIFNLEHLIIKNGTKENIVGNLFEGAYYDYNFRAKLLKFKNSCEFKKIKWIFYFDNNEIFKIKINLYKVTSDNSTVLDYIISYVPKLGQSILEQVLPELNNNQIFKNVEEAIQKQFNALYQYESCLIQGSPEEIWNILSDNSKLVLIAPNNECFLPININDKKVGETFEIKMNINDKESNIEVKLDLLRKKMGNKWIFCYTILGGKPFNILKQSLFVQLTKINNNETQLSISTKIYENINSEMIIYLSNKKKYVLTSLKDYFLNFYTPLNQTNK